MRFIEHRIPSALEQVRRVLAIPVKRTETRLVHYLTRDEMQAVLDAPSASTRASVRDRAMLHVAYAGGLRVSELVGLRLADVTLGAHPSILVRGKGRRERALPLWKETTTAVRAWLALRGDAATVELFLNARGEAMTRAGFEYLLAKYVAVARASCPSLKSKRVSPHVLRHTCAMHALQATRDVRKVALWLGHANVQTTELYLRADPAERLEALQELASPQLRRGRFRQPDALLAMLGV
ncbi:integrase [Corallococcus llansteffanensis]|uniref:Integrase n=2 Tax=Corallococcus llansteffanensis TaxID=2316731 RepID=A0A3A8P1Y6_9BACT|nr:integrase [Corallococcus llansteffanensis]